MHNYHFKNTMSTYNVSNLEKFCFYEVDICTRLCNRIDARLRKIDRTAPYEALWEKLKSNKQVSHQIAYIARVCEFAPDLNPSAEKFVGSNNGADRQRNIYFLPNAEFGTGKRGKNNLSAVRFLHADLDAKDYPGTPSEQLDRIVGLLLDPNVRPKTVPVPSAVIFSGGGYQSF